MKVEGRELLIAGSFLAGLGVALGAVGSHALKELLIQNDRIETYEIAVRYHLYHGLALILIGALSYILKEIKFALVGAFIFCGVVLFSGSLYVLSLSPVKWVAYVTPIGGVLLIGGWLMLFVRLFQIRK